GGATLLEVPPDDEPRLLGASQLGDRVRVESDLGDERHRLFESLRVACRIGRGSRRGRVDRRRGSGMSREGEPPHDRDGEEEGSQIPEGHDESVPYWFGRRKSLPSGRGPGSLTPPVGEPEGAGRPAA